MQLLICLWNQSVNAQHYKLHDERTSSGGWLLMRIYFFMFTFRSFKPCSHGAADAVSLSLCMSSVCLPVCLSCSWAWACSSKGLNMLLSLLLCHGGKYLMRIGLQLLLQGLTDTPHPRALRFLARPMSTGFLEQGRRESGGIFEVLRLMSDLDDVLHLLQRRSFELWVLFFRKKLIFDDRLRLFKGLFYYYSSRVYW